MWGVPTITNGNTELLKAFLLMANSDVTDFLHNSLISIATFSYHYTLFIHESDVIQFFKDEINFALLAKFFDDRWVKTLGDECEKIQNRQISNQSFMIECQSIITGSRNKIGNNKWQQMQEIITAPNRTTEEKQLNFTLFLKENPRIVVVYHALIPELTLLSAQYKAQCQRAQREPRHLNFSTALFSFHPIEEDPFEETDDSSNSDPMEKSPSPGA